MVRTARAREGKEQERRRQRKGYRAARTLGGGTGDWSDNGEHPGGPAQRRLAVLCELVLRANEGVVGNKRTARLRLRSELEH